MERAKAGALLALAPLAFYSASTVAAAAVILAGCSRSALTIAEGEPLPSGGDGMMTAGSGGQGGMTVPDSGDTGSPDGELPDGEMTVVDGETPDRMTVVDTGMPDANVDGGMMAVDTGIPDTGAPDGATPDSGIDAGGGVSCQKVRNDIRVTNNLFEDSRPSLAIGTRLEDSIYGIGFTKNGQNIAFISVDSQGNVAGPELAITQGAISASSSAVAWNGLYFGMAWRNRIGAVNGASHIEFTLIDTQGQIANSATIENDPDFSDNPDLVWTGTEFVSAWYSAGDIYLRRLDPLGNPLAGPVQLTNNPQSSISPALTVTDTGLGLAWQDALAGTFDIYVSLLDSMGNAIGSPVPIATDPAQSNRATIAWTGAGFGACWEDTRDGNAEIYCVPLDQNGQEIGTEVRITDTPYFSTDPALVWSGSAFGLAWDDGPSLSTQVYFLLLDEMMNPLTDILTVRDPSSAGEGETPSLAYSPFDDEFVVAFEDTRGTRRQIYASRIKCE